MDLLKWLWRVLFLVTVVVYLTPLVWMQFTVSYAYGVGVSDFWSFLNMLSLVTTPLLIYIPVEVFFHLHKVSTSE